MKLLSMASIALFSLVAVLPNSQLRASWSTPVNLSTLGSDANSAKVAVNSTGNSVAVWGEFDGSHTLIRSSALPFGGSWSTTVDLSASGYDSFNPALAVNSGGTAVAAWETFDGTNTSIQVSTRSFGGSWTAPVQVSDSGQDATCADVGIDSTGNLTVTWQRSDGTNLIIQAARKSFGGGWSAPVDLSATGQDSFLPVMTVNASGKVVLVWTTFDGANLAIQSGTYASGTGWSSAVTLSGAGQDAVQPQVAINSSGDAVATWARFDGSNFIVQGSTFTFGGSWSTPVNLSATGLDSFLPEVAIDSSGNAVAVWMGSDGTNYLIRSSVLTSGNWSAVVNISVAGGDATNPEISVDSSGNAVALWTRLDGSNFILQSSTLTFGGTAWTIPVDLSGIGQDAVYARVAVDPSGNAIVTWAENVNGYVIQSSSGTNLFH